MIDEGLRMEAHPGIVFRDGPTGRRAGLAAGPDVWEVIGAIQDSGLTGEPAIQLAAEWGHLTPGQVGIAIRYHEAYRDEIEARIARNRALADEQRAAWVSAQDARAGA